MAHALNTASLLIACGAFFAATLVPSPNAAVRAAAPVPDANTLLLLNFDGDLIGADGETPATSTGLTFETTPSGQGVLIDGSDVLQYAAASNFDAAIGTIEFCVKPTWPGDNGEFNDFVSIGAASGLEKDIVERLWFFLNNVYPDLTLVHEVGDWEAGKWHHIALTWAIPGTMQTYVDGDLKVSHSASTQALMEPPIPPISIGSRNNSFQADAVMDQFRISNVVRTASEVLDSALACSEMTALELELTHTDLLVTWRITPSVRLTGPVGSVTVPPLSTGLMWSSSDPNVAEFDPTREQIIAKSPGTATITASFLALSGDVDVVVAAPARPPQENPIDPYLATPAPGAQYAMPVIIIRYLPSADGVNLDVTKSPDYSTPGEITLDELEQRLDDADRIAKFAREEASRFHGYKDPNATPSLGYRVVRSVSVYELPPPGGRLDTQCEGGFRIDFHQIFERLGISASITTDRVREIWFWFTSWDCLMPVYVQNPEMFDVVNQRWLAESNMASPSTGDISNSFHFQDDLPILGHTYILYGQNVRRTAALGLHNQGHQLEAMFSYANEQQEGNTDLFWGDFGGFEPATPAGVYQQGRCGSTHFPPNAESGYDYANPTLVLSDCEDWRPDGTGAMTLVNVDTWQNVDYAWPAYLGDSAHGHFLVWWMQNMPGLENTIPHGSTSMTNWWKLVAEWDVAAGTGCSLLSGPDTCPAPLCGNGLPEAGEQCDDGGTDPGDGCDENCQLEVGGGGCPAAPLDGCSSPGKAMLIIKDKDANGPGPKDKLVWKWLKGTVAAQGDFGNPTASAGYTLCVYAGSTPAPVMEVSVPAVGDWSAIGTKGYKYMDKTMAVEGVMKIMLKAGTGNAKAMVLGKDGNLPVPSLPLDMSSGVITQLSNSDNANCWEATFSSTIQNDPPMFKAKTP
jgi:cysteine-rich repeat protein